MVFAVGGIMWDSDSLAWAKEAVANIKEWLDERRKVHEDRSVKILRISVFFSM